jgi:hypothetical protein
MYSFGLFTDNFVPCYFGQQIESRSSKFSYQIFESDWIDSDLAFTKNMKIFVENLRMPVKFSMQGLIAINLQTFLKVKG